METGRVLVPAARLTSRVTTEPGAPEAVEREREGVWRFALAAIAKREPMNTTLVHVHLHITLSSSEPADRPSNL